MYIHYWSVHSMFLLLWYNYKVQRTHVAFNGSWTQDIRLIDFNTYIITDSFLSVNVNYSALKTYKNVHLVVNFLNRESIKGKCVRHASKVTIQHVQPYVILNCVQQFQTHLTWPDMGSKSAYYGGHTRPLNGKPPFFYPCIIPIFPIMKLQWCRKVSDQRIWLTKFHSDWQKINISAAYFIVRTDKIFKICPNDWHVQKDFSISATLVTRMAAFQGIHVHCINCETWWCVSDYREIVSTTQTDRCQKKWYLCAAKFALNCMWHKNWGGWKIVQLNLTFSPPSPSPPPKKGPGPIRPHSRILKLWGKTLPPPSSSSPFPLTLSVPFFSVWFIYNEVEDTNYSHEEKYRTI